MLKREEMPGFDWEEESACLYVIEVTGGYRQSGAQIIFKFHVPPLSWIRLCARAYNSWLCQ